MNKQISIGVDIGGSHISAAAVDLESGCMIDHTYTQLSVDNQAFASVIMNHWADCLREVMEKAEIEFPIGIGFAMPGPFDYVNGISLIEGVCKYDNLYGLNVKQAIVTALNLKNEVPVRFINDASAFAIGEAWSGAAKNTYRSIAITLGTGFGSAFMIDGVPQSHGDNIPKNGWVYCLPFGDSIADDSFSTRWFIKRFKKITGEQVAGVWEIAERARKNKNDRSIFTEFGMNLAVFLTPLLKKFNAEVLVIGGNIPGAYDLFGPALVNQLKKENIETQICISELKDNAAILGSARLADSLFWEKLK
ncbi:MAG: ROK family protein [Bacteroidota bacterium]|nr:ROK family protein [Bacteroidota bacterium]